MTGRQIWVKYRKEYSSNDFTLYVSPSGKDGSGAEKRRALPRGPLELQVRRPGLAPAGVQVSQHLSSGSSHGDSRGSGAGMVFGGSETCRCLRQQKEKLSANETSFS